jgi:two-component system sensor kinase FixL
MLVTLVLLLAVLLQLAAGILVLRLVWVTGRRTAWWVIALAILLMFLRRLIPLVRMASGDISHPPDMAFELVGLAVSVVLIIGIALIAPVFRSIQRTEERVMGVIEKEQFRIGQDLHDGLVQLLSGVLFLNGALKRKLELRQAEEVNDADRIEDLLRQSLTQARGLARGLCPIGLETEGIASVLRHLTENLDSLYGVSCRFRFLPQAGEPDEEPAPRLSLEMETHLYRIAQEAINNAIKHGAPSHIDVELISKGDSVCLRITDDGVGIAQGAYKTEGMGLHSMAYRAKMIGGSLRVGRGRAGGAVVECRLGRRMRLWRRERAEPDKGV